MSNLFTAVSVEQQEIVTGGIAQNVTGAAYLANLSTLQSGAAANINGSTGGGLIGSQKISTGSVNGLSLDIPLPAAFYTFAVPSPF